MVRQICEDESRDLFIFLIILLLLFNYYHAEKLQNKRLQNEEALR